MKIKVFKIFSCFLIVCVSLLAFQFKHSVKAQNSNFEPFEIGMTFPLGYEINLSNSNGVVPSKTYNFVAYGIPGSVADGQVINVTLYLSQAGYVYSFEGEPLYISSNVYLGYIQTTITPFENLELVSISETTGTGELGIFGDIVDDEPNVIYSGTFELLANLLFGSTENLSPSQIGTLEFISILLTIMCFLVPFIILFFIVRKLFAL